MAQQIQIRRDTATNWTSANPTMAQGELGLETNTGKVKIGNGTTAWNSLSYFGGAGALASLSDVSFTSLASGQFPMANASGLFTNQSLSSLIYGITSLGSLAVLNSLSYTSLLNQPSLSSLAFQATIDYTSAQLTNKPSLGSLSVLNSLTATDVGLGNVTNDAQLKIASNLSDLNNVSTARGNLSLGSLAVLNTVSAVLPSTASLDILFSNGISNNSTVSTNLLYSNNIYASTISTGVITGNTGIFASSISTRIIYALGGAFASTVTTNRLNATGKIISLDTITGANLDGYNYGDQIMPFWGAAVDGNIYLDGSQTSQLYPFVTYNSATQTYTLTRDVYAGEFWVYTGYTVITSGWRVFAYTSLTNEGTIQNNGTNASGTTAGTGGGGGFFRAGGNGATGLLAASAGAVGTAPTLPAANSVIGSVGARGASARSANTTFTGQTNSFASLTFPFGGKQLQNNYDTYMRPIVPANASTHVQATFSTGGGAGAKSIIGTTATSGGGGGGGGVVFLASPIMSNSGTVEAKGGVGGNAGGTGGVFGGGGGGGGGTVVLLRRSSDTSSFAYPNVIGGSGGSSAGTANTIAVGRSDGSVYLSTATVTTFAFTPNQTLNYGSYYIMSMHFTYVAGSGGPGVNAGAITGMNMGWSQLGDVRFGTIATPTRALFVFVGTMTNSTTDQLHDNRIKVPLTNTVSSVRVIIDEIQNTSQADNSNPTGSTTTASTDSATVLATNLGFTPTTNNMQYTVLATSGGTAFTAGTGVTMLNTAGTTAPILQSGVAISRASSAISWTTAAQAGAFTIDLNQPTAQESGRVGMDGQVLIYYA